MYKFINNEPGSRTDIFSFGVVLYEMATGKMPFGGKSAAALFVSNLQQAPVPPVQLNSSISEDLQRIIFKCLEKDPILRYQHVSEINVDLRKVSTSLPVLTTRDLPVLIGVNYIFSSTTIIFPHGWVDEKCICDGVTDEVDHTLAPTSFVLDFFAAAIR